MTGLEVLNRELRLPDEWQLGGAPRVLWAPSNPVAIDRPGFRDPGTYQRFPLDPVFGITLLDQNARKIHLQACERNWTPARLELKYRVPQALITERRAILPQDTFISRWTMTHAADTVRQFWIVLWTRRVEGLERSLRPQDNIVRELSDIEANPQGITFQETRRSPDGRELSRWGCSMGASFDADSWSVNSAETDAASASIHWESTPFFDLMAPGGLPGHFPLADSAGGPMYFALAYPFEIPPGERLEVTFAASFAPDVEGARHNLEHCVSMINPIQSSEEEWINWFEEVPSFTCSDPHLQKLYWYRWAQRKLWSAHSPVSSLDEPFEKSAAFEGDESSYRPSADSMVDSALARLIEGAWHHSAEYVEAELRGLLSLDESTLSSVAIAHASRKVLSIHPDAELLEAIAIRARQLVHVDVAKPSEIRSAPALMPWRLLDDGAPKPSLAKNVFACDLLKLLAWIHDEDPCAGGRWTMHAGNLAQSIQEQFWDAGLGFYLDRPTSSEAGRSTITAFGFYPLLAKLADDNQASRLTQYLSDVEHFWTLHPVPTVSRSDSDFNPDGRWMNQRLARPYHGRVWPSVNSYVIDAVGRECENLSGSDRLMMAQLLERNFALSFVEGDLQRPAFHEHYSPLTGRPAHFLGRQQPDGGWTIDHLIRFVAGIRPTEQGRLLIDPLPLSIEWFSVSRCYIGEHEIEVQWDHRAGLTVRIDENPAGHAPVGQALAITLPDHWESKLENKY